MQIASKPAISIPSLSSLLPPVPGWLWTTASR